MSVGDHELQFEDTLIEYLENLDGMKQWKYLPDITTTDQLWDNFKNILENNNQDKLERKPLSSSEFNQVKQEIINLKTPYQAGQFLYGFNGTSQVMVNLDDGKSVYLTVFDQKNIGAGNTVYQIVNQIERDPIISGRKRRRFDVTLLINGLPIIQIEEKANSHVAKEALNQMEQYIAEKQYTDIFSTLQILVGMTPSDIRYMSNATKEGFNTDFAFQWQDEKTNTPVHDWREFSQKMLSIPMAHQMATNYMILDGTKNRQMIKVMRPYQVYATQNVIEKIKHHDFEMGEQEAGYVWHTTGSGKTISSFKAAWLASQLPNVDKVVFLVDRVALTNQTVDEYKAYDPDNDESNKGVVSDTANKSDLLRKLKSKGSGIIVSSTQKMDGLARKTSFEKFKRHIVFIVDEAHRSTAGEMLQRIKGKFPNSAWIGYTGTPQFDDKSGLTTQQIFGDPLHIYTIRNAIADQNVLGFKVDFQTTLNDQQLHDEYLPMYFEHKYPNWTKEQVSNRIENMTADDMDDAVVPSVYDMNPQHIKLVVEDIIKHWKNRSVNYRYNAMFTTHVGGGKASTPMAMKYYEEFKEQVKHMERPLKVAVTFSQVTNNSDEQLKTNEALREAIDDYNKMFGSSFDDTQVKEYTENVVSRLNRTIDDKNYLDLVIVVDQLLTGFNAPEMNTLYVDRTLKGAGLIQAYSRTNRVQDMQSKPFGRIVNYRWPRQTEKIMQEALAIYANSDSANVQGTLPDLVDTGVIAKSYDELQHDLGNIVDTISNLTDGFVHAPHEYSKKEEFYSQIQKYNGTVAKIKQDDKYDEDHPEALLEAVGMTAEDEQAVTTTFVNEVKPVIAAHRNIDVSDLTLQMEHVKDIAINYSYLNELVAKVANQVKDNQLDEAAVTKGEFDKTVEQIDDDKTRNKIKNFVKALLEKTVKGLEYPVNVDDVDDLVEKHSKDQVRTFILQFKRKWGLVDIEHSQSLNEILQRHIIGRDDLDNMNEATQIIHEGQSTYKDDAEDIEVQKLSKIKYRTKLRDEIKKFADQLKKNY
ncbi:type I restriction endonuclease subunit R [Companilactobacillus mishanensis]|uniref:Type I restriction enzyme endonuclease subunit n=1 Tax=Companilactobacillus mishanensis TaxID=2486008 RepID=A0A5P0ZJ54_9LACO|nr:HsdR family type I site-specific deoxyribonuclease [Companilactobacillus mishanensis]MQS53130.1 type I restriction endonuclease subunit R [Companilactobacillus mishanensis]